MNDQFTRILRLAEKTGDTVIVTNEAAEHPVVIVPFETYASLRSGAQPPVRPAPVPAPAQESVQESPVEVPEPVIKEAPIDLPVAEKEARIPIEKAASTSTDRAYEPIPGREEEPNAAFETEERFYLESLE